MAFSYSADALADTTNHLRFLIQDTVDAGHFFEDAEIDFAVAQESNIYRAAANLCRQIAAKIVKQAGYDNERVDFNPENKAKVYLDLAKNYDAKADATDSSTSGGSSDGLSFPALPERDATFKRSDDLPE